MRKAQTPAIVYPPGETIRDELKARRWTQTQFAALIDRPMQFVSELLNGKRMLTIDTARELEAALGPSAQFWMNLEIEYRLYLASQSNEQNKKLAKIRGSVAARPMAMAAKGR